MNKSRKFDGDAKGLSARSVVMSGADKVYMEPEGYAPAFVRAKGSRNPNVEPAADKRKGMTRGMSYGRVSLETNPTNEEGTP